MNSLSTPNYDNDHDNNYDNKCSNDYNDYGNDYGNEYDNNYDNNCNDLGNDLGNEHDNDHENDNVSTTSKRSNGSEVWDFFKKVVWQKEKKTAKCSVLKCPHKEFSCGRGGSTRTLWRHLEGAHWAHVDNIKLWDMFATWIVNRQRPFTIIEDPELIEIVEYLNPTAKMRNLYEMKYRSVITTNNNFLNVGNTVKLATRSMLDEDIDDNDKVLDKIEQYISERPVNKDRCISMVEGTPNTVSSLF
ncbi:hypothetical protein C2G38_2205638 [Gigaspora rosea]|uniref:BED-type domain-containing protein n=1 Tax=Gigaspora rosea TaxID=44941 RepID=A0A397UPG7_9GLOM|nr:hypothetical protein C2G38_2205638 [Gigaspora rosea]